jgi:hypothetical protein
MKTEMDVLRMDERQRYCWLMANRVTLMVVGLVWVGMIAYELFNNRVPYFYIIMAPTFAVIRFSAYLIYSKRD